MECRRLPERVQVAKDGHERLLSSVLSGVKGDRRAESSNERRELLEELVQGAGVTTLGAPHERLHTPY